jgi:hypothetical protein
MLDIKISKALWWICLVVAPVVLVCIELFHPAGFTGSPGMYEYVSKPEPYDPHFFSLGYSGPEWWFALHMIQTPMVGLVAVGLWVLANRINDTDGAGPLALAWLSRAATFVFIIYYTALDSIGGFGVARTIINTKSMEAKGDLTAEQVKGVAAVIDATWIDKWVGGVGSFVSHTGSYAILAAAAALALALFIAKKAPWPSLLLLIGFGWELQMSHTMPHGPIAFTLLIVAALWMHFAKRREPHLIAGASDRNERGAA